MRATVYTTEKISQNRERTPEGFLFCRATPVARIGDQLYGRGETPLEGDRVTITRTEEEVFRPQTIASCEGKSVVNDHPSDEEHPNGVMPDNWKELTDGIMLNPRRGEGDQSHLLVADLLICDAGAIGLVEGGKVELSLGYDADYIEDAPGRGRQTDIIVNHVALVDQGRCGPQCAIRDRATVRDSAPPCGCSGESTMSKRWQSVRDAIRKVASTKDESEREKEAEKAEDAARKAMDEERKEGEKEGEERSKYDDKALDEKFAAIDAKHDAYDKRNAARDAKEKEDEREQESEEETQDALEAEAEDGKGKDARKAKDSAFLETSYRSTVANAEIIAPGLHIRTYDRAAGPKQTLDDICGLRRKAIQQAIGVQDQASIITNLRGGRVLTADSAAKLPCSEVRSVFFGLGEALRRDRANDSSAGRLPDGEPNDNPDARRRKTGDTSEPVDVNKRNREFWEGKR